MPYINDPKTDAEVKAIERQREKIKLATKGIGKYQSRCIECDCVYDNNHPDSYKWHTTKVWSRIVCHHCAPSVQL